MEDLATIQNINSKDFDVKGFGIPYQSHLNLKNLENLKNGDVSINNVYNCYLET